MSINDVNDLLLLLLIEKNQNVFLTWSDFDF